MKQRDCDTCIHHKADGCESWSCKYEPNERTAISILTSILGDEGTSDAFKLIHLKTATDLGYITKDICENLKAEYGLERGRA